VRIALKIIICYACVANRQPPIRPPWFQKRKTCSHWRFILINYTLLHRYILSQSNIPSMPSFLQGPRLFFRRVSTSIFQFEMQWILLFGQRGMIPVGQPRIFLFRFPGILRFRLQEIFGFMDIGSTDIGSMDIGSMDIGFRVAMDLLERGL
jgi:hypothetical protein